MEILASHFMEGQYVDVKEIGYDTKKTYFIILGKVKGSLVS
jgi:hypothetical protein